MFIKLVAMLSLSTAILFRLKAIDKSNTSLLGWLSPPSTNRGP
jgi:hypothetical protein